GRIWPGHKPGRQFRALAQSGGHAPSGSWKRCYYRDAALHSRLHRHLAQRGQPSGLVGQASRYFYNATLQPLAVGINWYNTVCIGWMRMGSGIGMMAGACLAIGPAKSKGVLARSAVGFLSGAVLGGRTMMMLS